MTFEYKLMTLVTNKQEKDKKFVSPFLYDPCFDDSSVILLSRKFSISENCRSFLITRAFLVA